MYPNIRCNYAHSSSDENVFYVLSKGPRAGMPALSSWPNSFVILCANQHYRDFFFWLTNAMFLSGKFKTLHRGSVIPFLNINDMRDCYREVAPHVYQNWHKYESMVETLEKLEQVKSNLLQRVVASEQLQKMMLQAFLSTGRH